MIDSLGGYRLLRTIGVGSRAEVYLAHPTNPGGDAEAAVLKLYGSSVSDESIFSEVEALSRAAGEHVVRLIDVATTPDGAPALVLTRHSGGSLARWLADRQALDPGEAITLLAPLALALGRLHAAGVAHGSLGAGSVLFDGAGSPTLACFGRASLFSPGLPAAHLEGEQAVLADVLAFGALAAAVLDRAGAATLARRARTEAAPGAWLCDFADALFELAEPLPLGMGMGGSIRQSDVEPAVIARLPARVIDPWGQSAAVPESVTSPAADIRAWRSLLAGVLSALARVRRPVWIALGAAVLGLAVALVTIPGGAPVQTVGPSAAPSAAPVSPRAGPVFGDDPVAAAVELVRTREGCIRELSLECFEAVDQEDSSALEADRALVRSLLEGGEVPVLPDAGSAVLAQRLGDSALIGLAPKSEPASLLLVKGEAGWRIRDYLEE